VPGTQQPHQLGLAIPLRSIASRLCGALSSASGTELMVSEVFHKSPSAGKRLFGKKNGISMGYGDFQKIVAGVQQICGTMPSIEQKRTIFLYLQPVNAWTNAQSF
jgi:hypothetical protein